MYWTLSLIVLVIGTTNFPLSGVVPVLRGDIYFNTQQACIDAGNAIVAASQANPAGRQHVVVMPACIQFP